jgi:hypothetical protein
VFYTSIIAFILLSIFALGAINFNDNLVDWIDKHWEEIRPTAGKLSMVEFKQHASTELVSLGAFSLTINISIFVQIVSILNIQGLNRVMITLFPLTQLLFIVFSSAIMMVAVYIQWNYYYSSALPLYSSYILMGIAIFIIILSILGYKAGTTGHFASLMVYNILLLFSGIVCLFTGMAMITMTSNVKELVYKEWPQIS